MLKRICPAISFLIILSFSVVGQRGTVREEYLKITPYVSTLEDVTKVYGDGHDVIKGREDYLSITYTINKHIDVSIDFFRDCNQTEKPQKERMWIVREIFFTFEDDLKLKPKDVFVNKKDFTACPYGDVVGQIVYFNKEKNIQFTYLSLSKAVGDLSIEATEKNKEKYKCKKDEVIFSLDPKGFRCKPSASQVLHSYSSANPNY
jgi:hypothetical protein